MDPMAEPVRPLAQLTCTECGREWVLRIERWRLYLTDHEPPQAVVYCPSCARREFS
jgi:hypothetical protein